MPIVYFKYCIIFLTLFFCTLPYAKSVDIFSDEVRYLHNENTVFFCGNVLAKYQDVTINCQTLEAHLYKGELQKITIYTDIQIKLPTESATADYGEYEVKEEKLTLKNNVVLVKDESILTGDELIYFKKTGESILKSNKAGSRVSATIQQ